MKKSILLFALAITTMMASAEVLNVKSVRQLQIAEGDVQVAGISPDGSFILLTNNAHNGLQKYVLATGETEILSTAAGAGYNAEISADSKTVVFRERRSGLHRSMTTQLMRRLIDERATEVLGSSTANMRELAVTRQLQMGRPSVSIEDRRMVLTIGGSSTILTPCGAEQSYIWPSVSPDARHILFYVCGRGAYVCDLQGKNVQFLGRDIRAPKWYNDNVVIGMNDRDNGEVTISSEIVAVSLDGETQVLTQGIDAMYPYASAGKIVCSGLNGETYLIEIQ